MGCDAQFFPPFSLFDLTHFSWNHHCGNGAFGERGDLHQACIDWARLQEGRYPALRWLVHCPNGGKRSKAEAGRLKSMGVKAGYPDLVINRSSGIWTGFAVELKSDTGRVSQDQQDWLEMFLDEGYLVVVIRSLDVFIEAALLYLKGESLIGSRLAAFSRK